MILFWILWCFYRHSGHFLELMILKTWFSEFLGVLLKIALLFFLYNEKRLVPSSLWIQNFPSLMKNLRVKAKWCKNLQNRVLVKLKHFLPTQKIFIPYLTISPIRGVKGHDGSRGGSNPRQFLWNILLCDSYNKAKRTCLLDPLGHANNFLNWRKL